LLLTVTVIMTIPDGSVETFHLHLNRPDLPVKSGSSFYSSRRPALEQMWRRAGATVAVALAPGPAE
jgi:hypothetical protein